MFRKVAAGLVKSDINTFVGEPGTIFFDTETGEFRLSNGLTPGGIPLGAGGGGGATLYPATSTRLGSVKIGENIDVEPDGTISVATPYVLPTASNSIRGGVRVGTGLQVTENGTLSVSAVPGAFTVSHIDAGNTISNVLEDITTIRFDTDSGFDVVDLGSGAVKVGMNSTFKTWKVDGQADLVATGLDTIELKAGSGIALTTNTTSNPKSLTISSTIGSIIATDTQLGVVKQGTNVNIAVDGTLSVPTGAGINKIEDIPDVNSTNLSNGDVLVYNAGGQRWDTTQDLFDQNFDAGEY
jgi:hypothetical protein